MVLVFTLPSWPLVFKLIRDRFAIKETAREEVMAKYRIVSHHDPAPVAWSMRRVPPPALSAPPVAPELLETHDQRANGEDRGRGIVIAHCYVERRLRREPLPQEVRQGTRCAR